jgi:tRNA modification GTPase
MTEMPTLRVRSKADLGPAAKVDLAVSAKTGEGLDQLLDVLREHAAESLGLGDALITRERHRRAFEEALTALRRRADAQAPELVAEEIRLALRALGRVAGRVDVEEVLDRLFASFCIGK